MMSAGLAMPLVPPQYSQSLIGLMGVDAFGGGAVPLRSRLKAALAEEAASVLD